VHHAATRTRAAARQTHSCLSQHTIHTLTPHHSPRSCGQVGFLPRSPLALAPVELLASMQPILHAKPRVKTCLRLRRWPPVAAACLRPGFAPACFVPGAGERLGFWIEPAPISALR